MPKVGERRRKYPMILTEEIWEKLLENEHIGTPETIYGLVIDLLGRMKEVKEKIKNKKPKILEKYELAIEKAEKYLSRMEKHLDRAPWEARQTLCKMIAKQAYAIITGELGEDIDFVFDLLYQLYKPLKLGTFLETIRKE